MGATRNSLFVLRDSLLAKICSIFLISYFLFLSPSPVSAQTLESPYWRTNTLDYARQVEQDGGATDVNSVRVTSAGIMNTLNAIGSGILDPSGNNQYTAVRQLGNTIGVLSGNPPVESHQYFAYMAGKAGFVDQAYAQSTGPGGFGILQPIQKIWVATRNIAYLIVSLILVVIGFMIMLRKKIDAQTVIGVQQALPSIVVTLLLITFSYAIAGLVIDMIYFVTFFGIKLLALNNVFTDSGNAAIELIRTKSLFNIGLANLFGATPLVPGATPIETAADAVGNLVSNLMGDVTGGVVSNITGLVSQPIAFVIFAVALLFALFKLFFSLLMSYIQIILLAVLGPLQLMMNALPGSDAFSKWFRNILANAMAFPAAALMIVFAAAIMGLQGDAWKINSEIGFTDVSRGVNWTAPLIFGTGNATGSVGNAVDAVKALLGFGILLMTPKVVDMVKEALQAPQFKYGSAIGEAVGFGWGKTSGALGRTYDSTWGYRLERQHAEEEAGRSFFIRTGRAPTAADMPTIRTLAGLRTSPGGIARDIAGRLLGKRF